MNQTHAYTLVLGASDKPERYSYKAIRLLRSHGHSVIAIGSRASQVEDVPILKEWDAVTPVETITLYLNPSRQEAFYSQILHALPTRIIFNPGTENDTLRELAEAKGIECIEACTLVMLHTGQY